MDTFATLHAMNALIDDLDVVDEGGLDEEKDIILPETPCQLVTIEIEVDDDDTSTDGLSDFFAKDSTLQRSIVSMLAKEVHRLQTIVIEQENALKKRHIWWNEDGSITVRRPQRARTSSWEQTDQEDDDDSCYEDDDDDDAESDGGDGEDDDDDDDEIEDDEIEGVDNDDDDSDDDADDGDSGDSDDDGYNGDDDNPILVRFVPYIWLKNTRKFICQMNQMNKMK